MKKYPRIGVGVFIFKEGQFLMGKRKGSHGADSWSVPGGWLEYQETLEDAAKREVQEETGLEIKDIHFGALTNNIFWNEDVHSITVWMISKWVAGKPQIMEPDKFIEQRWVDFDTMPEPLFLPWEDLRKSQFYDVLRKELTKSISGEK